MFEIKKDIVLNTIDYPDLLGSSMQLLKKDSLLFINDFRGDSLIHVFDIKNLQLIRKIFNVGNGPKDLISPLEIHFTKDNLYIFYRQAFVLYLIPNSMILEGSKNMKELFHVPSEANHLYPLSDSVFISSGFFQKRYALIDAKGQSYKEFGEYPAYWSGEKDIPVQARAMFHQASFLKHPNTQRFLTYSSHIIEIYDNITSDHNPIPINNILMGKYEYDYTIGSVHAAYKKPDTERGIIDVTCSDKYIFVVYDPNKNTSEGKGSFICVYDWDGNPIELWQVSKNISCIIVDEDDKKGFVIAEDPNDSLMYFDLVY